LLSCIFRVKIYTMSIQDRIKSYLLDTLGAKITLSDFTEGGKIPRYLNDLYTYKTTTIHDRAYILAFPESPQDATPAAVRKHFDRIKDIVQKDVIFICDPIPGWNRKRFIENRISFIIPGNQIFLPLLGLDLREYIRLPFTRETSTGVRPLTQQITLRVFREKDKKEWSGIEIAHELGISLMSVHRAFDELAILDAFTVTRDGKRRCLKIEKPLRVIWDTMAPHLTNPVLRRAIIRKTDLPKNAFPAGLSALAIETPLAQPDIPVYALKMSTWNRLQKERKVPIYSSADIDTAILELWQYEPDLNTRSDRSDILSVCLSLQGNDDERISQAVEQATGEILC